MNSGTLRAVSCAAGLAVLFLVGCGKKDGVAESAAPEPAASDPSSAASAPAPSQSAPPPGATAAKEKLPGENAVRESLAKKDYDTAVGGLLVLRGAATGDRHEAYMTLYGEVIDTLRAEASTDRKAAQALAQLNLATRAR